MNPMQSGSFHGLGGASGQQQNRNIPMNPIGMSAPRPAMGANYDPFGNLGNTSSSQYNQYQNKQAPRRNF